MSFSEILQSASEGFTPTKAPTTKAAPKGKANASKPMTKAAAEYATERLLKNTAHQSQDKKKESETLEDKRIKFGQIVDYYKYFPRLIEKINPPKKRKPIEDTPIEELDRELELIKLELGQPFCIMVAEDIIFGLLEFGETMYMKYIFRSQFDVLGDVKGLIKHIRAYEKEELTPEIIEIAIRWKSWLNFGPYSRLFAKIARKATERRIRVLQSMMLGDGADLPPAKGKEKMMSEEQKRLAYKNLDKLKEMYDK